MKFIATTSNKISTIPVVSGQLIFSRDDRVIYLDAENTRTSFQQIITVVNEATRQNLISPVVGFYFVGDTKALWNYDGSNWSRVSGDASQSLFFDDTENFPTIGEENALYVGKKTIYKWDKQNNKYFEISGGNPAWEDIS